MKFLLILIVILGLFTTPLTAKTYTVGVENLKYLPYYITEQGIYSGFAKELLDVFAESKDHRCIENQTPY